CLGGSRRRLRFDGRRLVGIQLRLTFREPLGATLGIPGSSVGTEAVRVGADRLARTLAARRQRLTIGAEARLLGRTGLGAGLRLLIATTGCHRSVTRRVRPWATAAATT